MIKEMDFNDDECSSQNNSFENKYNNQLNNDLYFFSKENTNIGNECFEVEFKKVFNDKDIFGSSKKEEEKDIESEKSEEIRLNKRKIFKLIYNANKYINPKTNIKAKKIFKIFEKNEFKNNTFDEIILYIKKLNNSSKVSSSNTDRYKLLKLEHKLVLELKTRLLNRIQQKENN